MKDDVPCRVSADLRKYMRDQERRALDFPTLPEFDELDDGIMHDLLGNDRLAKPVQALLVSLKLIEMTQESFGADAQKVVQQLLPQLRALREACVEEWADQ